MAGSSTFQSGSKGSKRSFLLILSAKDDLVKVSWKSDARKCQNHVKKPLLTLTSWVKDASPFGSDKGNWQKDDSPYLQFPSHIQSVHLLLVELLLLSSKQYILEYFPKTRVVNSSQSFTWDLHIRKIGGYYETNSQKLRFLKAVLEARAALDIYNIHTIGLFVEPLRTD